MSKNSSQFLATTFGLLSGAGYPVDAIIDVCCRDTAKDKARHRQMSWQEKERLRKEEYNKRFEGK